MAVGLETRRRSVAKSLSWRVLAAIITGDGRVCHDWQAALRRRDRAHRHHDQAAHLFLSRTGLEQDQLRPPTDARLRGLRAPPTDDLCSADPIVGGWGPSQGPHLEVEWAGDVVSGSGPQISAAAVFRAGRAGPCRAHADQRDRKQSRPPRVSVHGRARRRQDQRRPHPGQGAVMRAGKWAHGRALRRLRGVPGNRRGPVGRRHRDRRRVQHRRRRRPDVARGRALHAGQGAAEDLHHRRGSHVVDERVQRAVEDAGRTAASCRLHLRDHRGPQDPDHDPVALPALRLQADTNRALGITPGRNLGR